MGRLFETLTFFDDQVPHSAALNMAIDEALLGKIDRPMLRVYRWQQPAVSFGYFGRWEQVQEMYPGREMVRRWTGGGVVPHGADWTYSLLVPATDPFLKMAVTTSYRSIHGVLAPLLEQLTEAPVVQSESEGPPSAACFERPVRHDLLSGGRKIAGGAQRRTVHGLLHQGSVQLETWPAELGRRFAQALAEEVHAAARFGDGSAESLAAARYSTLDWLRRV